MSIRIALIAAFLIAAGAPLAVFWTWPHSSALRNEVDEVRERHLLLARNLGAALETYHRDVMSSFGAFAARLAEGGAQDAKKVFENLHFRHICVVDSKSGVITRAYMADKVRCPARLPPERLNFFRELASGHEVAMSGVETPDGGEPRIFLVSEVAGGLVVGAVRTTFFLDLQRRISFGRKGHAAIVDQFGRVLAHPLPSWEAEARDISAISAVRRMLAGESGVETFYSPALKGDMIAGFTAVAHSGWGVMVPQPLIELEETAAKINRDAMFVLAAGLVLSVLIGWTAATFVATRLRAVEKASRAMADGDTAARIPPNRRGPKIRELAGLRSGFNAMAAKIEAAHNEEHRLREQAELASHAKSAFLANMSHEIRTPMNGVLGMAEVLRQSKLDEEQRSHLEVIITSGRDLMTILNDVLDLSKIEAGKLEFEEAPFSPARSVRMVSDLLTPLAAAKGLSLTLDIDRDQFAPHVIGDGARFRQVLTNLIGNAVKFTENGGVSINLDTRIFSNRATVIVKVADTGPGVSGHRLGAIFEPFEQENGGVSRRAGGTGLGLSISRRIALEMGGDLTATSEPGQGATFVFSVDLPVADAVAVKAGADAAEYSQFRAAS